MTSLISRDWLEFPSVPGIHSSSNMCPKFILFCTHIAYLSYLGIGKIVS